MRTFRQLLAAPFGLAVLALDVVIGALLWVHVLISGEEV